MPTVNVLRNNFARGEVSERLHNRPQLTFNAAKTLQGFRILKQAGITKREGFRFVVPAKYGDRNTILIPFRFSSDQAYILEFGDLYMRVFTDGGQVVTGSPASAYELATTYGEDDLENMTYAQSLDVLFIDCDGHPPRRLSRTDHDAWLLSDEVFDPAPTYIGGHAPDDDITLSATTGDGVTVTADTSIFFATDVGRVLVAGAGRGAIVSQASGTSISIDVVQPFTSTSISSGDWYIDGSPATSMTPSAAKPIGSIITLTAGAACFRLTDVGRYISINGGTIEITSHTSQTVVKGRILTELEDASAAGTGTWNLRDPAWSDQRGWPRVIARHQSRQWHLGQLLSPEAINGSKTADYTDFALGDADDESVELVSFGADELHTIRSAKSFDRYLMVGTTSGVWVIHSGATDETITPGQIVAKQVVFSHGVAGSLPIRIISNLPMYIHRSRKAVMALRPNVEREHSFLPDDVTILSSHITKSGIVSWAYQEEPDRTIWLALTDGTLVGCTFMPEHDVIGWHRHPMANGGKVKSLAVIPNADESFDELWAVVERTVNGTVNQYIEVMTRPFEDTTPIEEAFFVDSGLTYSGSPISTVTGFDHLIGEEVDVFCDGMVVARQTVDSNGSFTLPQAASRITAGLNYASIAEPTDPDAGSPVGSSHGMRKRMVRCVLSVIRSSGAKHGPSLDHLEIIEDGPPLLTFDSAAPVKTGEMGSDGFGDEWHDELQYVLYHDLPLPFTLRSVAMKYEVAPE